MRVHINAAGREITIECSDANVTAKDIAAEALALWTATDGTHPSAPAFGLTSERRATNGKTSTGAGMRRPMGEVDA